jgi:hypothetical protein
VAWPAASVWASRRVKGGPPDHGRQPCPTSSDGGPEQATADAALRRVLARERSSVPGLAPAKASVPASAPSGARPARLAGPLLALVAALASVAVLASRRGSRRVRTEQTA